MITVTVMRINFARPLLIGTAITAATLGLAGCAGAAPKATGVVHVVAAENFWGNITSQLGGRDVKVTSLITNPNADPHLFETDAADAATLAQAQVIIENGAGYDTWMNSLLSADGGRPRVVTAARVLHITGSDPNRTSGTTSPVCQPWPPPLPPRSRKRRPGQRDIQGQPRHLRRIACSPRRDPGQHQGPLPQRAGGVHRTRARLHAGRGWLDVVTPSGFARAVEDGTDPSPADTLAMQRLLDDRDINVLLYNVQTVTPVTTQIRTLARQHHIPSSVSPRRCLPGCAPTSSGSSPS